LRARGEMEGDGEHDDGPGNSKRKISFEFPLRRASRRNAR
jgi:hypothetical protein